MKWPLVVFLLVGLASPIAAQRHIGELRLLGSVGRATTVTRDPNYLPPIIPSENLVGGMASFAFIYRSFSAGPEVFKLWGTDRRVSSLGGVLRISATSGRFRPHAVLGGGRYNWDLRQVGAPGLPPFWGGDVGNWFSGSLGGGITLGDPYARFGFTTEARAHRMLQNRDIEEKGRALYTLMMGVRVAW
jgi:hypothetical protein